MADGFIPRTPVPDFAIRIQVAASPRTTGEKKTIESLIGVARADACLRDQSLDERSNGSRHRTEGQRHKDLHGEARKVGERVPMQEEIGFRRERMSSALVAAQNDIMNNKRERQVCRLEYGPQGLREPLPVGTPPRT